MTKLPPNVRKKVAKGKDYFYFVHPERSETGAPRYTRLPDPATRMFKVTLAHLNAKHPRPSRKGALPSPDCKVYFIGGEVGAIKIGMAIRPIVRLNQLQVGSPIPLSILALVAGGRDAERAYHERFAHLRIRGEWFDRAPELLAEIERVNK